MLLEFSCIDNRYDASDGEQTGNKRGTSFRPPPADASAVGVLPASAERQGVLGQLDEIRLTEPRDDGIEVQLEER